jgi:ribosome recycling factor
MGAIEKAIQKSELGIHPTNDGNVIRLIFPPLTEERRRDLVKVIRKKTEDGKVALRNIRRDAMEQLKALEKKGASEDEVKRAQDGIQKLTDRFIKEFDDILAAKEKEIMEI